MYGTKEVCQTKEEVTSFIEKQEEKHADGSAASVFVCACVCEENCHGSGSSSGSSSGSVPESQGSDCPLTSIDKK